ncbi:MAG TPA: amylo-alpha-1,6-glucosidase [Ohtaekwangia sp.]|nr:amylo-alpha-1,6-glucosidase [Ohtaekwangia sp.]
MTSDQLRDFSISTGMEWLETNGLGGYAAGTVAGVLTRKYHGLLIAATQPPVGRMVVLSKLDETIVCGEARFELGANQYPGAIHPRGYQYLVDFNRDLFPVFVYQTPLVTLKKTIAMVYGENTTVIIYEVAEAPDSFTLELLPLYACRDHHHLSHGNDAIGLPYLFHQGVFQTLNYHGCPELFINVPRSEFVESKGWYYNVEYSVEQSRGLAFCADLYTHGKFLLPLKKGDRAGVIISTADPSGRDPFILLENERRRRSEVVQKFSMHDKLKRLSLAADQFIVRRGDLHTIIAGYPWFSDWGRDTMIALPGLCLVTGRWAEAGSILKAFAASMREGMLPNRFPDNGEAPEYNTIDATLWFFYAVYKYFTLTGDKALVGELLPALKESIAWHYKGTRHKIKVDPTDELLSGGEEGVQLTWMDAKVDGWVVTPRRGKAVEINALWYNALRIMHVLLMEYEAGAAADYKAKADRVKKNFNKIFWNEAAQCLYDYIDGDVKSADVRPNQLYAASLPFALLSRERAGKVLQKVEEQLATFRGLRSLSPLHPDYKPVYEGTLLQRDASYHQGTVWSYLLGPYVDALVKHGGKRGARKASEIVERFLDHLDEACIGSVSEIFDGKEPHLPKGCFSQAWGVAEVLRVMMEYKLLQ